MLTKYQIRYSKDAAGLCQFIRDSLGRRIPNLVKSRDIDTANRLGITLQDLWQYQGEINALGFLKCTRGLTQTRYKFVMDPRGIEAE